MGMLGVVDPINGNVVRTGNKDCGIFTKNSRGQDTNIDARIVKLVERIMQGNFSYNLSVPCRDFNMLGPVAKRAVEEYRIEEVELAKKVPGGYVHTPKEEKAHWASLDSDTLPQYPSTIVCYRTKEGGLVELLVDVPENLCVGKHICIRGDGKIRKLRRGVDTLRPVPKNHEIYSPETTRKLASGDKNLWCTYPSFYREFDPAGRRSNEAYIESASVLPDLAAKAWQRKEIVELKIFGSNQSFLGYKHGDAFVELFSSIYDNLGMDRIGIFGRVIVIRNPNVGDVG